MLLLSRKLSQKIIITDINTHDEIVLKLTKINSCTQATIGITAPDNYRVVREELTKHEINGNI